MLTAAQALPLISQYESGNQNVPNAAGKSTASGYYQIINGTWQQFATQAGVDLSQYPTALSAPQSVQTQVATAIYNQQGLAPWATNAPLMTAVNTAGAGSIGGLAGGTSLGDIMQLGTPAGAQQGFTASPNGIVTNATAGGGLINSIWEIASRSVLLLSGFALVFIAVIALLWQSKTVRADVNTLAP